MLRAEDSSKLVDRLVQLGNVPWPVTELEDVYSCPVCRSTERNLLHEDLIDNVFFCAPGKWTLWSCSKCQCAYLDPRPTAASIHLAYENYYTHVTPNAIVESAPHGLGYLKRLITNGYKNWRFGTNLQPASRLGVVVTCLMPSARARIDKRFRHLSVAETGKRVLDVGFGDGSFLENAGLMGWDAVGVDFDSAVVVNARSRGLNVLHGGLEAVQDAAGSFDCVTMNHVLEHVHDPLKVLRECHRLLKPGGVIWLETPNINSLGHTRFKKNWRGLEAPRHLVIFDGAALRVALQQAGFTGITEMPQASPCQSIYEISTLMEMGKDPSSEPPRSLVLQMQIILATLLEVFVPSRKEFLAVTAIRG